MQFWRQQIIGQINAHRVLSFAVGAVFGAVAVTGLLSFEQSQAQHTREAPLAASHDAPQPDGPLPVRLRIPEASIEADFSEPLGLTEANEVAVPENYESVGWYEYGPVPGETGPAVVLGHVDSHTGPAVFFSLGEVSVGDEIFIERDDGSVAVFAVTALERVSQDTFPTDRVYANIDHAGLRLITCTGTYDRGESRYSHNLIVFAELVRTEGGASSTAAAAAPIERTSMEVSRTSSPITVFIDAKYHTLWWMLLILFMFLGWSSYADYFRSTGTRERAAFIRNAAFSGIYLAATFVFFALGLLEIFWWILVAAWVVMVGADHKLHQTFPEWQPYERDTFFAAAALFFILSSLIVGFPYVWWPFFFIFVAATFPHFVKMVSTRLQISS